MIAKLVDVSIPFVAANNVQVAVRKLKNFTGMIMFPANTDLYPVDESSTSTPTVQSILNIRLWHLNHVTRFSRLRLHMVCATDRSPVPIFGFDSAEELWPSFFCSFLVSITVLMKGGPQKHVWSSQKEFVIRLSFPVTPASLIVNFGKLDLAAPAGGFSPTRWQTERKLERNFMSITKDC